MINILRKQVSFPLCETFSASYDPLTKCLETVESSYYSEAAVASGLGSLISGNLKHQGEKAIAFWVQERSHHRDAQSNQTTPQATNDLEKAKKNMILGKAEP
jgi:hypothetical protein